MKSQLLQFQNNQWSGVDQTTINPSAYQLILVFGERTLLEHKTYYSQLKEVFTSATIVSGSTSGEILEHSVYDDTIVGVAIHFEKTELAFASANIKDFATTYELGIHTASQLNKEQLKYVFVLSDGGKVNGTELVESINQTLGEKVLVTGGLAGDKARFEKTIVGLNDNIAEGNLVLVGFYGDAIKVGYGLKGGWDVFGPRRIITKAKDNVLFEIDHQNALELYKTYLGKYASDLPGSALLFPLAFKIHDDDTPIVRTILSIDEKNQSMTFAGNMPEGGKVRLMKANFDKLVYSAGEAATDATNSLNGANVDLAILISCVGRKLVLDNRIEEEIEAAADHFKPGTNITGFYSYGEISPQQSGTCSDLHNQTMTITTFAEL